MLFPVIFLLASPIWAFIANSGDKAPMAIAKAFQDSMDTAAAFKDREEVFKKLYHEFKFEGCGHNMMQRLDFTKFVVKNSYKGEVTEARADKSNIIYKMNYGPHKIEAMLLNNPKKDKAKLVRAQETLC